MRVITWETGGHSVRDVVSQVSYDPHLLRLQPDAEEHFIRRLIQEVGEEYIKRGLEYWENKKKEKENNTKELEEKLKIAKETLKEISKSNKIISKSNKIISQTDKIISYEYSQDAQKAQETLKQLEGGS